MKMMPSIPARIAAWAAPASSPQSRRTAHCADGTASRAATISTPNQPAPP
jgi:hypothetical protein